MRKRPVAPELRFGELCLRICFPFTQMVACAQTSMANLQVCLWNRVLVDFQ